MGPGYALVPCSTLSKERKSDVITMLAQDAWTPPAPGASVYTYIGYFALVEIYFFCLLVVVIFIYQIFVFISINV